MVNLVPVPFIPSVRAVRALPYSRWFILYHLLRLFSLHSCYFSFHSPVSFILFALHGQVSEGERTE